MVIVIKASWVRRLPLKRSHTRYLGNEELQEEARIERVRTLAGSGRRLRGEVYRIEKYGVFVKFSEGRGLVHISEMSTNRIGHPSEVISKGQAVQIYVIAVDDRKRISLSMIGPVRK